MTFIERLRKEYMKEIGEQANLDIWVARLKPPRYVLDLFKKINNGTHYSMQLFKPYGDRQRSLLRMTLQPRNEKVCIIDYASIGDIQNVASDGTHALFQLYNNKRALSADGRVIMDGVLRFDLTKNFFEQERSIFYCSQLQEHPYVLSDITSEEIGGILLKIKAYQNIVLPSSGGFAVIESMDERQWLDPEFHSLLLTSSDAVRTLYSHIAFESM